MARPEKVAAVKEIKQQLEEAEAVFLTEYAGLTVGQQQQLRRGLREGEADYRVLKMSLTKRAADELELGEEFTILLTGPTAIAFATDPAMAAKALAEFGKDHEALKVKGMLLAGEMLPPEKVAELAKLDSREVMLAKVAGILQAPMANLAGVMAAFTRNAANMFLQLKERKEQEAPPEAAAEPAPEAAAADEATEGAADEAGAEAEEASNGEAGAIGEESESGEATAEADVEAAEQDSAEEQGEPPFAESAAEENTEEDETDEENEDG